MSQAFTELGHDCLVSLVSTGASAGTSELDSSLVDMAGYDSVMFIVGFGTVTDASVLTVTAKENSTNSTSGWTAVTGGATASVTASSNSNSFMMVDVVKPSKRYVGVAVTRTAQNAVVSFIYAIQYNASSTPITQANALAAASSSPEV